MSDQSSDDATPIAADPISSLPEPDPMVPSLDLSEVEIRSLPASGAPIERKDSD